MSNGFVLLLLPQHLVPPLEDQLAVLGQNHVVLLDLQRHSVPDPAVDREHEHPLVLCTPDFDELAEPVVLEMGVLSPDLHVSRLLKIFFADMEVEFFQFSCLEVVLEDVMKAEEFRAITIRVVERYGDFTPRSITDSIPCFHTHLVVTTGKTFGSANAHFFL